MTGFDFHDEIAHSLQEGEKLEDVATMIDTLAISRSALRPHVNNYFFAATILCVLLRPLKSSAYRAGVQELRLAFRGITGDPDLQEGFANTLTDALRTTEDVEEALRLPIAELFEQRYVPVIADA
jgi:hypothetical protein